MKVLIADNPQFNTLEVAQVSDNLDGGDGKS